MKKLFLLLLVLVLSLSVLCACNGDGSTDGGNTDGGSTDTGNTDGGSTDGGGTEPAYFTEGLSFTVLQNGTCVLTGTGTATDADVVIPAEHEGKPVVAIGNSVFGRYKNLKSVTIPASVKEIRKTAFADCATLESVTFAEGSVLESIGEDAFYYCSELKSVTVPASVKTIGANAFYACKKLLSVTFADGSALEKIEKAAFSDCSALKSVSIPASVNAIGDMAFYQCNHLTSIDMSAMSTEKDSVLLGEYIFWSEYKDMIQAPAEGPVKEYVDKIVISGVGEEETTKGTETTPEEETTEAAE